MTESTDKKTLESLLDREEIETHKIRQAIKNFCTIVKYAVIKGTVQLGDLYTEWEKMKPDARHVHYSYNILDVDALVYSLQRLPALEMPKVHSIYIQNNPEDLSGVPGVRVMQYKMRNRDTYLVGEDYLKFVAKEDTSDIYDILTNLILFGKETGKIKEKLSANDPHTVSLRSRIQDAPANIDENSKNQLLTELSDLFNVDYQQMKMLDDELGDNLFSFLNNVLNANPSDINIRFDREFSTTDASTKATLWRERIQKHFTPAEEKPIHIISSNTHSIVNCLTGFAFEYKDKIIELARQDEDLKDIDPNDNDSLYYLAQKLSQKHAWLKKEKIDYEERLGIQFIKDVNGTKIDVQIIDADKLDYNKIDPRIRAKMKPEQLTGYIINIDYAFGRQGTDIMRELCKTYGQSAHSISILGKAGIVCGNRYEVMIPEYFISQIEGGLLHIPPYGNNLHAEDFEGIVDPAKVHNNKPMLTVPGTGIQNRLVLKHYKNAYGILGLEMEGIPYLESIVKAYIRGRIRQNVKINVGYWGSDNPLNSEESLSKEHMEKGFVPTYQLSIAIINKIFGK